MLRWVPGQGKYYSNWYRSMGASLDEMPEGCLDLFMQDPHFWGRVDHYWNYNATTRHDHWGCDGWLAS